MVQIDKKGVPQPTKIFPCDCMAEGLVVSVEEDKDAFDCTGAPFIGVAFWENVRPREGKDIGLSRWGRVKYALHILRGKSPWTDMVYMRASVAKNFAHHILYLISKTKKVSEKERPLVE